MAEITKGARLGFDYGSVRIGVAKSDPSGSLATPLTTLLAGGLEVFEEIERLVRENEPGVIYVGKPTSLSGQDLAMSEAAGDFAGRIAALLPDLPVRLVDERLSSTTARTQLRQSGRLSRDKGLIDAQAAAIVLQSALDFERLNERLAGAVVTPLSQ